MELFDGGLLEKVEGPPQIVSLCTNKKSPQWPETTARHIPGLTGTVQAVRMVVMFLWSNVFL